MLFDTTQLALERAIGGAARGRRALAANLANANTPGYQRVDVDFHSALQARAGPGGDQRDAVEQAALRAAARRAPARARADGNSSTPTPSRPSSPPTPSSTRRPCRSPPRASRSSSTAMGVR